MSKQLSKREFDVMKILWTSEKPLSATEIAGMNPKLSKNTIQAVLKTLLNSHFIEVADIVYSGTVLTRSYKAVVSMTEYMKDNFLLDSSFQVISSFIEEETDDTVLQKLNHLIQKKRKDLKEYKGEQ